MSKTVEIWKDVVGHEGGYLISNHGRIKSLYTGRLLAQYAGYDGYIRAGLYKDGQQKSKFVHRLVADAFIPNPGNAPEVNHIDEDKANNCVENLEWCTHKQNSNHGTRLQRMAAANCTPVVQYSKDGVEIARYASQKDAMEITGINSKHISCCCKGKRKSIGGYVWKYGVKPP